MCLPPILINTFVSETSSTPEISLVAIGEAVLSLSERPLLQTYSTPPPTIVNMNRSPLVTSTSVTAPIATPCASSRDLGPLFYPCRCACYSHPTNILFQLHRHIIPAGTTAVYLLSIILPPLFWWR